MGEQFLTLMADLDAEVQETMAGWYAHLRESGFTGRQTPGLPFHISLASFSPDREEEAAAETRRLAETFAPVPVHLSHIGLFAGGQVLFAGPDPNPPGVLRLREAIAAPTVDRHPWTPHATILIDDPEATLEALRALIPVFRPILGHVTRLHLCAFWPTREILSLPLAGDE